MLQNHRYRLMFPISGAWSCPLRTWRWFSGRYRKCPFAAFSLPVAQRWISCPVAQWSPCFHSGCWPFSFCSRCGSHHCRNAGIYHSQDGPPFLLPSFLWWFRQADLLKRPECPGRTRYRIPAEAFGWCCVFLLSFRLCVHFSFLLP